ncbi:MAG: thiamine-phosphate kinase [Clostridia bacterium]
MEGEFELIAALRQRLEGHGNLEGVIGGIGDDAAVLGFDDLDSPRLLATVDLLAEGIHFDRSYTDGSELGEKALVVNLSDIAAMGGTARYALVSLAIPPGFPREYLEEIYEGLARAGDLYGTAVVGGNVSSSRGQLMVDVAVMGEVRRPVYRSGARPGDVVAVSGSLGAAASGLRWLSCREQLDGTGAIDQHVRRCLRAHKSPIPRLELGGLLGETGATSMIDISDGLASEVNHLAEESLATMAIFASAIPIDESAAAVAARLRLDPLDLALFGGEDYELLFTIPPALWDEVEASTRGIGTKITPIGRVYTGDRAAAYLEAGGESELNPSIQLADYRWTGQGPGDWTTLRPGGWNHLKNT